MFALKELDELLRGTKASPELLAKGTGHLHVGPYIVASIVLGMIYGVSMGLFAVLTRTPPCAIQMLSSALKVPALFFLTLVVTLPSLYVFSALLGARLTLVDVLRLIIASLTISLIVLASLAPITAFFTLNTVSYPFMKLLNVFFFAVAGVVGLEYLLRMLRRREAMEESAELVSRSEGDKDVIVLDEGERRSAGARAVFRVWLVLYAIVGAQMGWVLRPFIGSPKLEFEWFRAREANVFIDIMRTLGQLLGG